MKNFGKLVATFLLTIGTAANVFADTALLDGHWEAINASPGTTFSIDLHQTGNVVVGQYCAVGRNGGKIDCDDNDSPNIRGTLNSRTGEFLIRFSSFFDGTNGRATLKVSGRKLVWHVTKWPTSGPSFAPKDSLLVQQ